MGPRGLAACALIVIGWIGLSYSALESGTAAQVIAIGAASLGASASLIAVWVFATSRRIFRRAARPVERVNQAAEFG